MSTRYLPASGTSSGTKSRVLVVDDDPDTLDLLSELLCGEGYELCLAMSEDLLRSYFKAPEPDVVLLDLRLPDANGLDLIADIKTQWPACEVVVLTNYGSIDLAVEAVKRGAFHFQSKPFRIESLLLLVQRAAEHKHLSARTETLQQAVTALSQGASPVFRSPAIKAVLRVVERVAPSDAAVFLTGESGTGKEVLADLIHSLSQRGRGPLVKVNCAALPRELIESELFGAVKGAYTGAHSDREGLFGQAEDGSILLDEITEMPLETQSKLLRVLQDKQYRPVGGKATCQANCRIIASTNHHTEDALRQGKLRADLYYRISTVTIHLPPLRDRREDIMPLASSFLKRFAAQADRPIAGFSEAAAGMLQAFDWPGNVRQLENEIQRAVLIAEGSTIDLTDLSIGDGGGGGRECGFEVPVVGLQGLQGVERDAIVKALARAGGNKTIAARELGVTRQTLYNKIRHFGLVD